MTLGVYSRTEVRRASQLNSRLQFRLVNTPNSVMVLDSILIRSEVTVYSVPFSALT
jgi:hypothetical protein